MTSLFERQGNMAHHGDGSVADYLVKVSKLRLSFQVQIMLQHLEKHFDILPLSLDVNNFLGTQVILGRDYGQPSSCMTMGAKNNLNFLLLADCHHNTGQDSSFSPTLLYPLIQGTQPHRLPLVEVEYPRYVLGHGDHRQVLTKLSKDLWFARPNVYKDMVGFDVKCQRSLHHIFKVFGGLGHGFKPTSIAASPFIKHLADILQSFLCLCRGTQDEIKRKKTCAIRPPQWQKNEFFKDLSDAVVKFPGQKLNCLGSGLIMRTIIKDQNLLFLLIGKSKKKLTNLVSERQHEPSSVIARVLQEFIGFILPERQVVIGNNASEKVVAFEGQQENGREKHQRRNSLQFPNSALVEKNANVIISTKRCYSALQLFCFLLHLIMSGNIIVCPSFLILLLFLRKTICVMKRRAFSILFI